MDASCRRQNEHVAQLLWPKDSRRDITVKSLRLLSNLYWPSKSVWQSSAWTTPKTLSETNQWSAISKLAKNIIPLSRSQSPALTLNLPWGGTSTVDTLSMSPNKHCLHLWGGLFFSGHHTNTWQQKQTLTRSRAKLVRSSQVDRESWQRLITMNNEWLTGSLYKELFRFRHTLTIYSHYLSVNCSLGRVTQLMLLQPLYLCWIFPETHCQCALHDRNQDLTNVV